MANDLEMPTDIDSCDNGREAEREGTRTLRARDHEEPKGTQLREVWQKLCKPPISYPKRCRPYFEVQGLQ